MLFKGVATAMVTPIHNDKIDYDKLSELIDSSWKQAWTPLSSAARRANPRRLFDDEKKELFEKSVQITAGGSP